MTDDEKPPTEEQARRITFLTKVGKEVYAYTHDLLHEHYDCNCINCRSFVLNQAMLDNFAGQTVDDVERSLRITIKYMLKIHKEVRNQRTFAEANRAQGIDPNSYPRKPNA